MDRITSWPKGKEIWTTNQNDCRHSTTLMDKEGEHRKN